MICPNCNHEIKDGNVYCENCGFEIQFVPEFEPEIDHAIEDSISNLVESAFSEPGEESEKQNLEPAKPDEMGDTIDLSKRWKLLQTKDLSQIVQEEKNNQTYLEEEKSKKRKNRWLFFIPIVIGVIILAVIGFYANSFYRQYKATKPEALLAKAQEFYHDGDFAEAENNYRMILDQEPLHYEARLGLARCLRKQNVLEEAATAYEELIADEPSAILYEELIELYEAQNDYESINEMIRNCNDETLYREFSKYISEPPAFSEEEGTYDDEVVLKIMAEKAGNIYYTLDGSEPNESSIHYDTPIRLENGKYVVRAVFVNEMGVFSESVAGVYEVHAVLPKLPTIKPTPGKYTHSSYIVVSSEQGFDIYYTKDGTMPDENAAKYEGPLPMSLGKTEYKFVCVDEEGRRSDIASVTYDVEVEAMCTETDAINCILASIALVGQTSDLLGTSVSGDGKYEYSVAGVIPFQGSDYYLIEENLRKTNEEDGQPTGKCYAIDTKLGLLFVAQKNEQGEYLLLPFS